MRLIQARLLTNRFESSSQHSHDTLPNLALRLFLPEPDHVKGERRVDLHEVLVVLSNSTLLFFISRRFHLARVAL